MWPEVFNVDAEERGGLKLRCDFLLLEGVKVAGQMTENEAVGILILILAGSCLAADGRQYKAKDRARSTEQSSDEGATPFSAEFGEFFEGGPPKDSGEGFGFSEDFNPDFIPYSESRNVTKYVNPATSYHSVKDMPGHGRDHTSRAYKDEPSYRSKEPGYRGKEYRDSGSYRKEGSHKDEPGYRKEEKGRKEDGDSYHKDRAYRKSDSFRKEDSYRSKDGAPYRSEPSYRKESASYRSRDSYKKDDDRPPYRSRSSDSRNYKDGPSYRSEESSSSYRKDDPDDRGYRGKRPIQTMYDDWSPEDDKPSYRERDRGEPELSSEYDEPDYRERDDPPPPPPSSSRYSEKEPRSKSIPTSMRPGPPYYNTPVRRTPESHQRTHTTSFGVRHEYPPPPTPQTYYAPSTSQRKHDTARDFHHRKGEPAPAKSRSEKEWAEFRPSPPDPLQNSRARSREEYPQTEYSNPVAKKITTTTQKPLHRQNCIKLKKTSTPEVSGSKYTKKVATCYVCVDEKTGMNYEECSYESDSKTRPFIKTTGQEEATRTEASHRDKRDVAAVEDHPEETPAQDADRQKREKDYYESSKESKEEFNTEGFDDSDGEKESGSNEEEDSSSENCYKKRKGEMSCIVCQTPNKKGSYEQCSYASEPSKNKYEHSVEKVYGSPRLPESSNKKYDKKGGESGSKEDDYGGSVELAKEDYGDYDSPGEDSNGKKSSNRKTFGDFGSFGGGFGDGFESIFGDLSGEGFDFDSIPEPAENEGQFSTKDERFNFKPDDLEDIDMTKNIGDFGQKNRSNCKKVMKNKMTCYQCVSSKGTKNEECMYVAAAEPKSKHLSFSQVQEYRFDPLNNSKVGEFGYPSENAGKRKFKKYHPDLVDMKYFSKIKEKPVTEGSRWPRSPGTPGKAHNVTLKNGTTSNQTKDLTPQASDTQQTEAEAEEGEEEGEGEEGEEEEGEEEGEEEEYRAVPTEPPELDLREAERGEFHADTEPAWDPKLGISLPRYMLERSEHEAVFDEVLASG